jgi:hypothetical protein
MAAIRCGPARVPSRESPVAPAELLVERGYAARERDIRLSLHAPIPAFLGHPERGRKYRMAVGMLDHSAGIAVACGAEPVVIHPGFLFGRERRDAIAAVIEQLRELRTRLEPKGRAVWFGVEVMGRARELGTLDDVLAISSQMCPATTKQAGIERVAAPRMPKGESCRAIFATCEAGRLPVVRGLVRAFGAQDRASGRSER